MDGSPSNQSRDWNRALPFVGLVSVIVLSLAALFSVDYVPTTDGPHHVFSAHVHSRMAEVEHGWSQWFEPNLPVSNLGFGVLYGGLDRLMAWRPALLATQAIMVLLWTLGAFFLARQIHPDRVWAGLLIGAAAFQWSFYMGFFSYYIASALALWILAYAISIRSWRTKDRVLLAGLLLIQSACHVLPAATTGILLACLAWTRCEPRERSREILRVAAMGLPALIVVGILLSEGFNTLGDLNRGGEAEFAHRWPPLWTLAKCFVGGPEWRAWPLVLLAIAAPVLNLRGAGGWQKMSETDRALLLGAGGLALLSVGLPLHLRAWDFFSVRFIPPAIAMAVLLLPIEKWEASRGRFFIQASAFALACALAAWPIAFHQELEERSRPVLAGLAADLERQGPRLPVIFDAVLWTPYDDPAHPMPFTRPLGNVGPLYALEQGGLGPYNFALNEKLHYLRYSGQAKDDFPAIPDPDRAWATFLAKPENLGAHGVRGALITKAASFGTSYEDLIFHGTPAENQLLAHLGYTMDFSAGKLSISHFEGCPLEINLPEKLRDLDGVQVEVGWYPLTEVAERHVLPEVEAVSTGPIHLSLSRTSCATIWFRVRSRPAVSGDPRSGIHFCEGSDEFGKHFVKSVRDTPQVECKISGGTSTDSDAMVLQGNV